MTQLEILEQEEQTALEALQKSQNPPKEQAEASEVVVPLTEILKEEKEQKEPEETKPVQNQEDTPKAPTEKTEESFNFEKEFETHGYKLNPEKQTDPRYLAGKFFSTAGLLKKVSNEKKQAEEKYKTDIDIQKEEIADLQRNLAELKEAKVSKPVDEIDNDNFKKEFGEFEVDKGFLTALDKRYMGEKDNEKMYALEKELETLKRDSYETRFWNEVYTESPKAKNVSNEIFDVWLEQPHYGNLSKKNIYDSALERGDTKTVAKLFSDCLNEIDNDNDNEKIETIPDNIQSQISAQPIKQSPNRNIEGKPIFTDVQIKIFDDEVRTGKISPAEAKRINVQIEEAYMEGRVRLK